MGRKGFILVAAAVVLLTAAVFTYISLSGKNTSVDKDQVLGQETTAAADEAAADGTVEAAGPAGPEPGTAAVETTGPEIIRSEDIEVRYGSPEYDLKALLCEDSGKRTFVKLEYYLEGAGTTMEADSQKLPELAGIFEKREGAGAVSGAFKVRDAYLNPVFSKVYLRIAGDSKNGFEETALYSLNLKDFSVKKLFDYSGKYTDMSFNRDYSLLGYSFSDPPYLSVYQENELFEVLDCKTDGYKVRGSRTASGKIAGEDRDPAFVYDYTFKAWQSNTVARLKQAIFSKKDPAGKLSGPDEVLYDTAADKFMNMDGSPAAASPAASPAAPVPENGASPGKKAEDEAAKVLADFYSFLPSEKDYQKAMGLLDEGFKLQLELLQQFGAVEITKGDISSEGASMYSEILKAAKLDSVVKVESADGIYTLYYYQTLSLNADSQVRQALSAQIRKEKDAYKIVLIKDADGEKPPFAQQAAS